MKRARSMKQAEYVGQVVCAAFGRVHFYKDAVHGDTVPLIVMPERADIAKRAESWFSPCWDMETAQQLAEDADYKFGGPQFRVAPL